MKKLLSLICLFMVIAFSVMGKSEVKLPDSYSFLRGIETFNDEKYDEALEWFNKEIAENPDNGYAYLFIAFIRSGNEEVGKAMTAVNQAIKKIPKKDKSTLATAYSTRGELNFDLTDTVHGLEDLAMAIKVDPTESEYYKTRGQIYYEMHKYDLSDADYNKMISLDEVTSSDTLL